MNNQKNKLSNDEQDELLKSFKSALEDLKHGRYKILEKEKEKSE